MSIELSKALSENLETVNVDTSELEAKLKEIKEGMKVYNILLNPEVAKTLLITAFRESVKQEAEKCLNCKDSENLKKLNRALEEADLHTLQLLVNNSITPINNINYSKKKNVA